MSEEKKDQPQQDTHDWKREAHRQAVMRIVESAHRTNPFYDNQWTAGGLPARSTENLTSPSPSKAF
ncbi:MAG: hypothetical protein P8N76_01895 [Pirellulaceae bacterium]|nr:hypothetical protein [Pirellulaceae bacterium]